jgi:hypothetical protein
MLSAVAVATVVLASVAAPAQAAPPIASSSTTAGTTAVVKATAEIVDPSQIPSSVRELAQQQVADVPCELGKLVLIRKESCAQQFIQYRVIQLPSGAVLGTGTVGTVQKTWLSHESRSWRHLVRLGLLNATGVVAAGTTGTVTMDCTPGGTTPCTALGGGTRPLPFPTTNVDFPYNMSSPNTGLWLHKPTPTVNLFHPAATEQAPPVKLMDAGEVRCDATPRITNRFGGCVYPVYTPSHDLSVTNALIDDVAWHIYWAQNNLKTAWGKKGAGPALTRTTDRALRDANRLAACPRNIPRPAGKSCDEYPFATTYEGGSKNPDHSCHMIDENDNTRHGRDVLRPFYRENRLLDGDKFWVHIDVPRGVTAPAASLVKCPG